MGVERRFFRLSGWRRLGISIRTMISKRYLQLALDIQRAATFDRLTGLLTNTLPEFIGGGSGFVFVATDEGKVEGVYGTGIIAETTRRKTVQLENLFSSEPFRSKVDLANPGAFGFSLSDFMTGVERTDVALIESLQLDEGVRDCRFGMLNRSHHRIAMLVVCSHDGIFDDKQEALFDSLLLIARGSMSSLSRNQGLIELGKFYREISPEARKAIFIVEPSGEALPFNYDALRLAEQYWTPDEAFRQLDDRAYAHLRRVMLTAWRDPVTAQFTPVTLDLGLADDSFFGVPGVDERIFLIHVLSSQGDLARESLDALLTKRQREIMDWTAEGKTSAETGIILGISPRTVEKHLEAIFQRLGVENRVTAVRRYLDLKNGHPF